MDLRADGMLLSQIGFLTEWQMYAQKIEGDSWLGDKIDQAKMQKMSGKYFAFLCPRKASHPPERYMLTGNHRRADPSAL